MKMDIRRIRYFITFCETLNFSEAARQLGLSQPALSKAIRKLEDEIGGPLIRREGIKTHLTHLGRLMHEQLQKVDATTLQAELAAKRLVNGDMPQIQIAVMCTIGPSRFCAFLQQWRMKHPEVEIVLRNADRDKIGDMLLSGYVDCALVGGPLSNEPRFKYTELFKEDMVVAFSPEHRFSRLDTVDLKQIMQEPYLDRLNCEFRDTFMTESARVGHEVQFAARSEREDWIQTLARGGVGVTILPIGSVIVEGLETRLIGAAALRRTVSLAAPFGREDTVHLRSLLSALRRFDWKSKA
jgi:LysR family hydrogen peroxide-inducible transcriptional activator